MRGFRLLYALALILIIADVVYTFFAHPKRHFYWEVPAFSAAFGFVMCIALVVISKSIGKFIMKEEDYYEKLKKVR
ncbi:hypothetical protein [Ferroglobus sp.]|uniref:hypothetical protein n=1 Tax=Ferroglobus sp. TaxID=2614230 RepID=UPI0025C554B3|nr:hypothetical protein [Ferroglobus sp.]